MAITQNLSTGKWDVSVCRRHPITKKPVSKARVAIATRAQAQKLEKQLYEGLGKEFQRLTIPTWRACISEFIEDFAKRDISLKSVENYRLCLESYTNELWGERLVTEINEQEIRQFINSLSGKVSVSHQKNMLKYIRAVMNYACSQRYISYLPVPSMKFRIGDKIKTCLTESQAKMLLSKAKELNSEWFEVWMMALHTGMRNGELYALTWDKVDFENKRIKVDCSWSHGEYKTTKSGSDRWVEIAPGLEIVLRELLEKNQNPPFVLPRIDAWDKGEQARALRMFLEGVGLPRIRFHDLRATCATIMLSKGVEPLKVMIFFGWKDLKTMAYYIRRAAVEISGITQKMDLMASN